MPSWNEHTDRAARTAAGAHLDRPYAADEVALFVRHGRQRVAAMIEMEQFYAKAEALGLTRDEATEVFGAWSDWHRSIPDPLRWDDVRAALTLRASGMTWRPEDIARERRQEWAARMTAALAPLAVDLQRGRGCDPR
jgi:hypothetical protein